MTALNTFAWLAIGGTVALFTYAYLGYPALIWILGKFAHSPPIEQREPDSWPVVSVTAPVYNEEDQVEGLIRSLLALDYPPDRLQILIVSDASSDQTDEIVRSFADQGVELFRLNERSGKTKAENAALPHIRGDFVVNTDASIRITPGSLKKLIATFSDPEVGLASGRDVSVGASTGEGNLGENSYVGYEMAIRDLETRVSGIVGASGCYYAIRRSLHQTMVPESLSRDFAAALYTRENGYRAVSVPDATCLVPRATSLRQEYRRKVRTITRGWETLYFKRSLLNPFRFGVSAWMLLSHKVCRWVFPWAALLAVLGLGILALSNTWARFALVGTLLFGLFAWVGWQLGDRTSVPRIFSLPAYVAVGNVAAAHALIRFFRGDRNPVWEPTRRDTIGTG